MIPKRKIGQIAATANLKLALSMALDRQKLEQFLPAGYQVDSTQAFDAAKARQMIKGLGLQRPPLQVWVGKSIADLTKATAEMLTGNAGLTAQLTIVDDGNQGDLLSKIQTSTAAGSGPDIVIGDFSIADALGQPAAAVFDRAMVRF